MTDTSTALSTELVTEIASFEPMLGNHGSDYWRGPRSAELQQRYRSLLETRDSGTPPPAKITSAAKELAELEKMIGNHGSDYWRGPRSAELQARYQQLISGQAGTPAGGVEWRASPAEARRSLDPALVAEWDASGGFDARLRVMQDAVAAIFVGIGDPERAGWLRNDFFGFIRPELQRAILGELAMPASAPLDSANDAEVGLFSSTAEGKNMVTFWGAKARRNVAIVRQRFARLNARLDAASRSQFVKWFDALSPAEAQSIYHAITEGVA